MLHYPKIPGGAALPGGRGVAFEKLDGTNLHFQWDRDFAFHALGTRRDEFNLSPDGEALFAAAHPELAAAPGVFRRDLLAGLDAVFRANPFYAPFQEITAFAEYVGPESFAGRHRAGDATRAVLFDVRLAGYGFVGPHRFLSDFAHLPTPRVVFAGKLTGAFAEAVRAGRYGTGEGVVCKGGAGGEDVWMAKVKTDAYLARLKQAFGERWEEHWE